MKGMRFFLVLSLSLTVVGCAIYRKQKEAEAVQKETEELLPLLETREMKPLAEIDLSKIGHIPPKGRVQDARGKLEVVDQLRMHELESIPYLIGKLDDETEIKGPVLDYWSRVTVGDVALVILTDFMTKPDGTVNQGFSWEELFRAKKDSAVSAEQYLKTQLARHDRKWLKQRWADQWAELHNGVFWDAADNYYALEKTTN